MIDSSRIAEVLKQYGAQNPADITIGVLGGHSALDVCRGAKKYGFQTVAVCQKGREKTYAHYYKTRDAQNRAGETIGCVDEVIVVDNFKDITKPEVQDRLRKLNTIFVHNRYFWVYCDFAEIENNFAVPLFGTRNAVRLEERDQPKNQYYLLEKAGIRLPKIFKSPKEIDRMVMVKVAEATRSYERAFFTASSPADFAAKSEVLILRGDITKEALDKAVIEEYVLGAHVNLNFFYSPFADEVELLGTDTRRQTNLDGLLRLPAREQELLPKEWKPKMIETGHMAVTVKESLLEKIFAIGEKFIAATKSEWGAPLIGPFALQGAVVADDGKEDFVIFDVSMRIPGSPGTRFTPYTGYLYGEEVSVGDRVAMEIAEALKQGKLEKIVT